MSIPAALVQLNTTFLKVGSYGYGGKYGVQADRKDQSALGFDHQEKLAQHKSQRDYAAGFGGKHGIQKDRQDQVSGFY